MLIARTAGGDVDIFPWLNQVRILNLRICRQSTLESDGWTEVSLSQAKPGDVVIMQGGGIDHTELICQRRPDDRLEQHQLGQSTGELQPAELCGEPWRRRVVPARIHGHFHLLQFRQHLLRRAARVELRIRAGDPSEDGCAGRLGSGSEWQALSNVENAEAGFNPTVENPSSGALGIAEALGHGNANTAGTLGNQYGGYGLTDAQAKAANSGGAADQALWMVNYIKSTYGTPEAAWAHEQSRPLVLGQVVRLPSKAFGCLTIR